MVARLGLAILTFLCANLLFFRAVVVGVFDTLFSGVGLRMAIPVTGIELATALVAVADTAAPFVVFEIGMKEDVSGSLVHSSGYNSRSGHVELTPLAVPFSFCCSSIICCV